MKAAWSRNGNSLIPVEKSSLEDLLTDKVYVVKATPKGDLYLDELEDKLELPAKVYGMEADFVARMKKTYEATTGNLGILLNGEKGTGKSVTAKQIANNSGLPIILVNEDFEKLLNFLSSIQQNVVVFLDEYEKVFKRDDEGDANDKLLTIMDGVMKSSFRRMFLMTTNDMFVHDAMLQRPGRIRYVRPYGNLAVEAIREIVDDMLHDKSRTDVLVNFIAKLELITVDIVVSLVQEVNIHAEDPEQFAAYFNVKEDKLTYDVFTVLNGTVTKVASEQEIRGDMDDFDEYCTIYTNRIGLGTVMEVLEPGTDFMVELNRASAKAYKMKENDVVHLRFVPTQKNTTAFMMAFKAF